LDSKSRVESQDTCRIGNQKMTARPLQGRTRGQDNQDRTVGKGHLGEDNSDKTARNDQSRQVSLTGQPGWVSLDRTERIGLPGHDSGVKRAVDKVA
jgi:hypothetical protein